MSEYPTQTPPATPHTEAPTQAQEAAHEVAHQPQVQVVPGEAGGYRAPGGATRPAMRERIATRRPYISTLISVPQWEETIEVRSLPLGERNEMMMSVMDPETNKPDVKAMYPALLIAACYDPETQEKVFSEDDAATIQGFDANAVDLLAKEALSLSGMGKDDKDAAASKS